MSNKSNSKSRKSRITDDQIKRTLTLAHGVQSEVARILQIDRSVICNRIKDSLKLQSHCRQLVEQRIDKAEQALDRLVEDDNTTACIFLLKTIGRSRGYIEHAPLEDVDTGKLKVLGEFFSSIGAKYNTLRKANVEAQVDLDSLPGKTDDRDSNGPSRQSHF